MKVPLSWLRQYVDVVIPAQELAHRLTMAGIEVGEVIETGGWSGCFVGRVVDVRPHPQADRLRLCRVSTGTEELEVVCGAPNVAAGQKTSGDIGKKSSFDAPNQRSTRILREHGLVIRSLVFVRVSIVAILFHHDRSIHSLQFLRIQLPLG